MTSLLRHVALVSESDRVPLPALTPVAAALQKQAVRDLAPAWDVSATVDAFPSLEQVPVDYWPIIIRDDIDQPGASGIHLDRDGQPFALVTADDDVDVWSLTSSHEAMEMLVDPFGNRLVAGDSLKPGQGRVNYLVEVCDPCEGARYAYTVNDVRVSDFYTPHFFDPVLNESVRYSYTGAITAPRAIREDGYISWIDPATGITWQQIWFGTEEPEFRELGLLRGEGPLRAQVDRRTAAPRAAAIAASRERSTVAAMRPAGTARDAAAGRAAALRDQIGRLTGKG
jgi:hypothetical protein